MPVALGCVVGPFDLGCGLARLKPLLPLLLCIIRNMVGQREIERSRLWGKARERERMNEWLVKRLARQIFPLSIRYNSIIPLLPRSRSIVL